MTYENYNGQNKVTRRAKSALAGLALLAGSAGIASGEAGGFVVGGQYGFENDSKGISLGATVQISPFLGIEGTIDGFVTPKEGAEKSDKSKLEKGLTLGWHFNLYDGFDDVKLDVTVGLGAKSGLALHGHIGPRVRLENFAFNPLVGYDIENGLYGKFNLTYAVGDLTGSD